MRIIHELEVDSRTRDVEKKLTGQVHTRTHYIHYMCKYMYMYMLVYTSRTRCVEKRLTGQVFALHIETRKLSMCTCMRLAILYTGAKCGAKMRREN